MPSKNPAYLALLHRPVVTLGDATTIHRGDRRAATQSLYLMHRNKLLVKVRRGLYVPGPRQDPAWQANWDPYLVASRIGTDAVIAFHSAFVLHGVAQNPGERRVHFALPAKYPQFSFEGIRFDPFTFDPKLLRRASMEIARSGEGLRVTRPEWTIAMSCRLPSRGGGFEEIVRSSEGLPRVDVEELLSACEAMKTRSIYNRVGFLLWQNRRTWRVPPEEIRSFQNRMSETPVLFGTEPNHTAYLPSWNLLIPPSAKEVVEPGPR